MKKRSDKEKDLEQLKSELATISTVILTTFQGITVEDDTKLRRTIQAAGGDYKVVKNTLIERAAAGTAAGDFLKDLTGPTSIAFTQADPVALAKAITKFAKDVPVFKIKAGLVEGRVLMLADINQLAQLPSKDELIGKIMFLINAPAQRMASALAGVSRNVAVVVSEAQKANKFAGGGAAE